MAIADLNRFKEVLAEAKSILIILPENPDMDTVAAGLGLSVSLNKHGKATTVSSPVPMTVEFNRLVGVDKVREDLGDKNLVVSFADYPADAIERVAYNIENGEFVLSIVPKPGQVAPQQDQIITSYSGLSGDLIIVINANYPDGLGKFAENPEILEQPNLAVLSNMPLSGWPKVIELIDPNASSVSDAALELIQRSQLPLDEDVATNLFMGIERGTQSFTSQKVTAQTFNKAAELMKRGARRATFEQENHFFTGPRPKMNQAPASDLPSQFRETTLG